MKLGIEDMLGVFRREPCWRKIVEDYLNKGILCPSCGRKITGGPAVASFMAMEQTCCESCGHTFHPKSITPLGSTDWEPEEFARLAVLSLFGRTLPMIAKTLGKPLCSVEDMLERMLERA